MNGRRPVLVDPVLPENIVRVVVDFNNPPTSVTSSFAQLKYNKDVALRLEFDDGGRNHYNNVFKKLNGGTAGTGVTYAPVTYDDGTGKSIEYRASVAVFSVGAALNDLHNGSNSSYMLWTEIKQLVDKKWGLINHQYGGAEPAYTYNRMRQIHENTKIFYDKMLELGIQYRSNVLVIPAADEGYVSAAYQLGLILVSSQGGTTNGLNDGFPSYVDSTIVGTITPNNTTYLRRFNMGDQMQSLAAFETMLATAFTNSTGNNKYVLGAFSHGPGNTDLPTFSNFIDNLSTTSNNRLWVPSSQEFIEYIHVKRDIIKTRETVYDKRLILEFDTSNVHEYIRCLDLSLLLNTDADIANVSIINGDDVTFNPTTKLINVYKERTSFANPLFDILPPIITGIAISGTNPKVLNITYDRSVTQTLVTGYSVDNNTVVSISGSGTSWQLTCESNIVSGLTSYMYYRMQNGNAVDSTNASLKVCSFIKVSIP